jgi:hypothetical protein
MIFFSRLLEIPFFLQLDSGYFLFGGKVAIFGQRGGFEGFGNGVHFDGDSFVDGLEVLGDDGVGGGKHVIEGNGLVGLVFAFGVNERLFMHYTLL